LNQIVIELAECEHLAAIPAIEIAAAAMIPEADLPMEIRYLVTEDELLLQAQNEGRLWVALTDYQTPVGFAMADIVDGVAHLDEMDVLPEFGRQGIGSRLLRTFVNWARSGEFSLVTLVTFRHLPWNAPFYEKMGFVPMGPAEIGAEMTDLLSEEARAGIDVHKRICMKLDLTQTRH